MAQISFVAFVDEFTDEENADEYLLATLVREYGISMQDIEPALSSADEMQRYAALCALGVLCHNNAFHDNLRLLRLAITQIPCFATDAALEWAMWNILPDWWDLMTDGLIRFGALCAWLAFLQREPVDESYSVRVRGGKTAFKYEVLLHGIQVLNFESDEIPPSVGTTMAGTPVQLTLF